MAKEQKLEEIVGLDELTTRVKNFFDSANFKWLKNIVHKAGSDYYNSNTTKDMPELVLDETKARDLAGKIWDVAAEHIAVNYLRLKAERIKELKEINDPASGKPQFEAFIKDHLGVGKDDIYDSLKNRKVIKTEEIDALLKPIYDAHATTFTSKAVSTKIDSIEKANAVLSYLKKLQEAHPKAYESFNIPTAVKSVEEAQRLYASAIQLLPRDYKPKIAEAKKATGTYG